VCSSDLADENIPFCVFKPTGVGRFAIYEKVQAKEVLSSSEKLEYQNINDRIDEICKSAHDHNVSLFIDAEETWIQDTIDELVLEMMKKYNNKMAVVYNTIQFYRANASDLLKKQHQASKDFNFYYGIKMVRGAYMEQGRDRAKEKSYASPIHETIENTDQCYDDGLRYCAENNINISLCAGTHNEESSALLMELLEEYKIEKANKKFFFAQLYGMSDHISFNLAKENYNVAKYVPYGPIDRKSTRLNSSHGYISYAVFCLKKKKTKITPL